MFGHHSNFLEHHLFISWIFFQKLSLCNHSISKSLVCGYKLLMILDQCSLTWWNNTEKLTYTTTFKEVKPEDKLYSLEKVTNTITSKRGETSGKR